MGGGLFIKSNNTDNTPTVATIGDNILFRENKATDGAGGLEVAGNAHVTVGRNAVFIRNTSDQGGALCISTYYTGGNDAQLTFGDGAQFTENTATNYGGALTLNSNPDGKRGEVQVTFADVTFTNNSAGQYGGAINARDQLTFNGAATFTGNTVTGNDTSTVGGGALFVNTRNNDKNWGVVTFNAGASFTGNKAGNGLGGAIYNDGKLTLNPALATDTITFSGNADRNGANDMYLGAASTTTITGAGTVSMASGIAGLAGAKLTKSGTGTLQLAAAGSYAGIFIQQAGTTSLTGSFLGGDVRVSGGELVTQNLAVAGTKVRVAGGKLTVNAGGSTTFTSGSTLILSGGTVTADRSNFLTASYAAADNVKVNGTAGELNLRFATGSTYTAAEYKLAKASLFTDGSTKTMLTFLNANLKLEQDEQLVVGADQNGTTATLSNVVPVVVKNNEAASSANAVAIDSVLDRTVSLVAGDDAAKTLLNVNTVEVTNSTFEAKNFQLAPADASAGVTLNLNAGAKITLIGGDSAESTIFVDGTNATVQSNVAVGNGATLNLGLAENTGTQGAFLGTTTIADGGTVNINGNTAGQTQYNHGTLKLQDSGQLKVLNASTRIGTMNAAGGSLFVDPAYVKVDALSDSAFGTKLLIGSGSVMDIGSIAELQAKALEAGLTPVSAGSGSGFTVAADEAMLALGKKIVLGAAGQIVVDAAVDASGQIKGNTVPSAAWFGDKSLLVVNAADASGSGVITANAKTDVLTVKDGAKLYIADAKANQTYTVASNFDGTSSTVQGWTGSDLVVNRLVKAERQANADGSVTVKTTTGSASGLYPSVVIPQTLDSMIAAGQNSIGSTNSGIAFLSRSLEPLLLAEEAVVPTLNSAAQMSIAGGVQDAAMRSGLAPARSIQDHLSLDGAPAAASATDKGLSLWFDALYGNTQARGFDGGSLNAGYNTDLRGVVFGGDYSYDAFRFGLALNVGSGDVRSHGGFNKTKNEFDFWGISAYGNWRSGNVNIMGDLGYSTAEHTVKQDIPASLGLGNKMKADIDSSVITAGVRGEYRFDTDWLTITPHAGVRYLGVTTDSYTSKLDSGDVFKTDKDLQHIWQLPVGVSVSKDFAFENGWKLTPKADLAVVPTLGDTKAKLDVRVPGIAAGDTIKQRVFDETSFDGTFGVQAEKDNISLGLKYNIQASEHATGHGVTASFMYKF